MDVVDRWTGAHAAALQEALRETAEGFAKLLDISPRTVAKWRANPAMVCGHEMQQLLDVTFERAPASVRARFARLMGQQAVAGPQALRVAIAVVVRGPEVLLVLRNDDGAGIGWGFVAGIVKPGQRAEAVAVRETRDETGVLCRPVTRLGERTHPVTGALCEYWHCTWLAGEPANLDGRENVETLWVPAAEVARFIPREQVYGPVLDLLEGTPA